MKRYLLLGMLALSVVALAIPAYAAVFVKYDGVDGESADANHDKWIDVLSIDWGMHQPGSAATGQSRRRGGAVVEDMIVTVEYEKSSPKLQEKLLKGEVIPKLEIEQTATYGGVRATYLKYELKNVMVTSYGVHIEGDKRAVEEFAINFEEIKVTYTEYDDVGRLVSTSDYTWNTKKGGS